MFYINKINFLLTIVKPLKTSGFTVKVVFVKGVEPLTYRLGGLCSILLSYTHKMKVMLYLLATIGASSWVQDRVIPCVFLDKDESRAKF